MTRSGGGSTTTACGSSRCSATRPTANRVLVTHAFDSRDAAEAFVNNTELQEKMASAGVDGSSVKLEYFDEVEMEDV